MAWRARTTEILALIFGLFAAFAAHAGDHARLNVIGFSDDGSLFAFEEYGIQDGSGFPYANRFYINTADDSFVTGTPIRVRIDEELTDVSEARNAARDQAAAAGLPGDETFADAYAAGVNAITELSAAPHRMRVNPRPVVPPIDQPLEINLREIPMVATGVCEGILETVTGFELLQAGLQEGETARLLHRDETVPTSRNCPLGYQIGGIYTFFPDNGPAVMAIMLAVRSFGFEGPDFRWMAVTAPINP